MALKYANDYSQDAATHGQLWSYGGRDKNTLLAMLYALLQAWQGNDTEYGIDQQNKYIDMLLNQQEKKEDRQYSEEWRDNERDYNSAQAQLARLMATGMSRDAAMRLLGSAGGSGGSSAAPVTSTLPSGLGSSAIDYENMKINDRNSWANIVFGSFQTASACVSAGFSIPTALASARNTNLQTQTMNQQTDALDQASQVINAVNGAIYSGAQFTEKDFETPQAMREWISNNTTRGGQQWPMMKQAEDILTNGGNGNPFFQSAMQQMFDGWHAQRGFKENPDTNALMYSNLYASAQIAQADVQKAVQDIVFNDERMYEIFLDELQKMQALYQNDERFNVEMQIKNQEIQQNEKNLWKSTLENDLLQQEVDANAPFADATRRYYNALFDQKCTELFVGLQAYASTFGNINTSLGLNKDNVNKFITGFNDSFESELFYKALNRRMNESLSQYSNSALFQFSNAYRTFGMSDVVNDFYKGVQTTNDVLDTWHDNDQPHNNNDSQDGSQNANLRKIARRARMASRIALMLAK